MKVTIGAIFEAMEVIQQKRREAAQRGGGYTTTAFQRTTAEMQMLRQAFENNSTEIEVPDELVVLTRRLLASKPA